MVLYSWFSFQVCTCLFRIRLHKQQYRVVTMKMGQSTSEQERLLPISAAIKAGLRAADTIGWLKECTIVNRCASQCDGTNCRILCNQLPMETFKVIVSLGVVKIACKICRADVLDTGRFPIFRYAKFFFVAHKFIYYIRVENHSQTTLWTGIVGNVHS